MRPMPELTIETMQVDELVPYAGNAKLHPPEQVDQIAASIEEFGNCDPIAVWTNADGEPEIVEGHGRVMALRKLGIAEAPVIRLDHLTDEQRRAYVHVHNQTTLSSTFDFDALAVDIADLPGFDWDAFGFDDFIVGHEGDVFDTTQESRTSLKDRFGFVPFSVIMATASDWMDRKHKWINLGIRSEQGRDSNGCYPDNTIALMKSYKEK